MISSAFTIAMITATVSASIGGGLGGGAETLFKKYAMMKIFEDCYGKQVVQSWWAEMREATYKCRGQVYEAPLDVDVGGDIDRSKNTVMVDEQKLVPDRMAKPQPIDLGETGYYYMPMPVQEKPTYPQNYQRFANPDPFHGHYNPSYSPVSHLPFYYINPISQPNFYYSQSGGLPELTRQARGIDKSNIHEKIISIIGNMTCIMRELNFLDATNQPDIDGIHARIMSLPIPDDIKQDMFDGVDMCSEFSKCVPLKKYDSSPVLKDITRPYVFFNCFKTQKLMACIKKDFRDQFGMAVDENIFTQRSGFASMVDESAEEIEISMFAMMFGFSDKEM